VLQRGADPVIGSPVAAAIAVSVNTAEDPAATNWGTCAKLAEADRSSAIAKASGAVNNLILFIA
jgi:hypothetical protein